MAVNQKGRWGNAGPSRSRMQGLDSPSVHFFKIILPSTIDDQKLKLPRKFAKKFGNELSAIATITVPNGRIWQLGFQKTEGRVFFVDGWQEFVEYHSIDSGYLLVFRYDGFSKFHVCIFDKTAIEISYPWNAPSSIVEPYFEESSEDGDGDGDGDEDVVEISKPKTPVSSNEFVDKLMFASRHLSKLKMSMQSKRAIHAARSCKYTRPSFIVILHKYNKHLHVPMDFVIKYKKSCSEIITLEEASNGKQWQVSCSLKDRRSSTKMRLSKGWRQFVRDNNLKAGDVCVFELIKQKDTLLKVSIYHADPANKCSNFCGVSMAAKRKGRRGNVEPSSGRMQGSHSPSMHFFKAIIPSTLDNKKLKLPRKFVKKFGNELSAIATVTVPNGRTWQLGMQKTEGRILFVDGWQEFVEYHSIDSGYFLVFRYQGCSKFHVCIFDKTDTEIDYHPWIAPRSDVEPHFDKDSSEDNEEEEAAEEDEDEDDDDDVEILKPKSPVSSNEFTDELMFVSRLFVAKMSKMSIQSKRALHAARSCKCTNPCFIILFQTCNYLHVPVKFVEKYMLSCPVLVTLEAFNGKQWHVSCSSSRKRLTKGWREFVRDNNLKPGDVCVFELLNEKNILLKVSIYYANLAKKCFK